MTSHIRNIAIIAHIDHGKTTLVDKLLQQSNTLDKQKPVTERAMDSGELEGERGITILAKNTAVNWKDYRINIVDTPGHADFGGEVERGLTMVDSVLLLIDAVDGPMPQTRFVTQKAFKHGLKPIVVINKIDRPGARPEWAVDQVFDLFVNLGATDEQLDFPVVYTSALRGFSGLDHNAPGEDMTALFQTIVDSVPAPKVEIDGPFQMQLSSLDYSSYVGAIGIGKITRGSIRPNQNVVVMDMYGNKRTAKIMQVLTYLGLERTAVAEASAGDIVAITGIDNPRISDTICDPSAPEALPPLTVDEPTVIMTFQVNTSPFSGKVGKYVTSRQILARLETELIHNVALRVNPTEDPDKFRVAGRGELHLSILIETMRREGYELAVSRPEVIIKVIDGQQQEPYEMVMVDIEEVHQGSIMEALAERKGKIQNMTSDGKGRIRLDYLMPTRGLIGFHTDFLTQTSGTGLMYHVFDHFGPLISQDIGARRNGAMISNGTGKATGFALWNLEERGALIIGPQTEVYEGMIVGFHNRVNDLVVNVTRAKQLTNVRASGTDDNIVLTPHLKLTLEQALEYINNDELVEVTPQHIRLRKKFLLESDRKRAGRE